MKNILRLLGGVFPAAALVIMLTAPLTGCNTGNGPGDDNPEDNPQEEQPAGPSVNGGNISFGTLSADLTQAEISAYIDTAMGYLATQAGDIAAGYAVRTETGIVGDALSLARAIRYRENDIKGGYGGDVNGAVSTANTGIVEVSRLINAAGGRNLFAYLRGAFMTAQRLAQREHGGISEDIIKAQLAPMYQLIVSDGGTAPQQSSPLSAQIASLNSSLTTTMPSICGEPALRNKLIQQWEDSAQFEGWTEDIAALGFEVTRGGAD